MKTKPMTHVVTVETDRDGSVDSRTYKVRCTSNTVVTEMGERFPRDGTWKQQRLILAASKQSPSVFPRLLLTSTMTRIIPSTLRRFTLDELRGLLLLEVERLREDLTAACTEMKEAKETVDSLLPELAAAEATLAEFDKRHGDKEDGA